MKTTNALATALAFHLFACAGADTSDTEPVSADEPQASATASEPKLAASPLEKCTGQFRWRIDGRVEWLHQTSEGCILGTSRLLSPDGTVVPLGPDEDRTGRWEGDEYYFTITLDDGNVSVLERTTDGAS